ncbi:hypothetical protein [Spiroplasma endosymbiont of Labia minor]|uniref:hypothetical protein n=1 Tax=Spiroplasma endosymbiont of Labia minor TaxID=3066305 RepID=UPI0030D614BC
MSNLFANGFFNNGQWSENKYLIINAVAISLNVLLLMYFVYLVFKFNKNNSEYKIKNRLIIGLLLSGMVIAIVLSAFLFILYTKGESILSGTISEINDTASALFISLSTIACVITFAVLIITWFTIYYVLISFEEDKIQFTGEFIAYNRIIKLINDENRGKVYIIFRQGRRGVRKLKYSKSTVVGAFMLENLEKSGHKFEVTDGEIIYRDLVKTVQSQTLEELKKQQALKKTKKETKDDEPSDNK